MSNNPNFNLNLIKIIQKYFDVLNCLINNLHLFTNDSPSVTIAQNLSQKVWMAFFENPIELMRCNLEYQGKIMQHCLTLDNPQDLLKTLHAELFGYYENLLANTSLSQKDIKYLLFFIKQFLNATAPENFIVFNNKVLQNCLESNFQTLLDGLDNFKRDLLNSKNVFSISNVDKFRFTLGENIAATEGAVIYRNELIELICYQAKEKSYAIPILLIPPCINRYYILDLSPNNSFVKWLVENNFQVFLISWINPKSHEQNFTFEHYISQGVFSAIEQITKLGYKKINTLGYCIGGTILASALAYLAQEKNNPVHSATFLNTMLDFSDPGELEIFIRQEIIQQLENSANANGYLDGVYLYHVFNLLKSKELVWSYYINNYLQGFSPKAFDILYWNADYVNLPAKMFSFYLKNFYMQNLLIQPGGFELMGKKLDLKKITVDSFFVAAKLDHIVPWQQSYKSMLHLGGAKEFVLSSSGHVAGIINPPSLNKHTYFCSKHFGSAQEWLALSQQTEGSWWGKYLAWLKERSGKMKKSIDYAKLHKIAKAPGSYAL